LFARATRGNWKRIDNIRHAKNKISVEQFINSLGHEQSVRKRRSIVGLEKGCTKLKEKNLVTLTDDIKNKLRSSYRMPEIDTQI